MAAINVFDPKSYKDAKQKQYECYMCKPPVGTAYVPTIAQTIRTALKLNPNVQWLSPEQTNVIAQNRRDVFDYLNRCGLIVTPDSLVITDALGIPNIVKISEALLRQYKIEASGSILTTSVLVSLCERIDHKAAMSTPVGVLSEGYFDWVKLIHQPPTSTFKVLFVPVANKLTIPGRNGSQLLVNDPQCKHGKGDFIVCLSLANRLPNFNTMYVVNGIEFGRTFNNQGWTANLVPDSNIVFMPKPIFQKSKQTEEGSAQKLCKRLYEIVNSGRYTGLSNKNGQTVNQIQLTSQFTPEQQGAKWLNGWLRLIDVTTNTDPISILVSPDGKEFMIWHSAVRQNFPEKDWEQVVQMSIKLACIQKVGWQSNCKSPILSASFMQSLQNWSECGYIDINQVFDPSTDERNSFCNWLDAKNLYEGACQANVCNMTIYRGMRLSTPPQVGQKIALRGFTSWSFSLGTAKNFGEYVFQVDLNQAGVHGIYIDLVSHFRGEEFEVLLAAGYNLFVDCVRRYSHGVLYECSLRKDFSHPGLKTFSAGLTEGTKYGLATQLAELALTDVKIGRKLWIDWLYDSEINQSKKLSYLTFKSNFSSDPKDAVNVMLGTKESKDQFAVSSRYMNIVRGKIDYNNPDKTLVRIQEILHDTVDSMEPEGTDSLYTTALQFMFNISSKFQSEGFQIKSQTCSSYTEFSNRNEKYMTGKLIITGDNDDHIVLQFKLTPDLNVVFRARSNHIKGECEYTMTDPLLYDKLFMAITKKFKLDQHQRVRKVIKMVASYEKQNFSVQWEEPGDAVYAVGDAYIQVKYNGNMLMFDCYNEKAEAYYWDNMHTIASRVSDIYTRSKAERTSGG